jgi:putative tryptophan/tyrosine transport system substrate-binding protein
MRRRDFLNLMGGVAAAWPISARAQRGERVRRVGGLIFGQGTDREIAARVAAFRKTLQELGWTPDANLLVDVRFGVNHDDLRDKAKELIGLARMLFWRRQLPVSSNC